MSRWDRTWPEAAIDELSRVEGARANELGVERVVLLERGDDGRWHACAGTPHYPVRGALAADGGTEP